MPPKGAQFGRHVVRVPGISPADVAGAAVLTAYGSPGAPRPSGVVLVGDTAWRETVVAASLAAPPVDAAVLPEKRDYLPTATADMLNRLRLRGFRKTKGLTALVLGRAGRDLFSDLNDAGLKASQLEAPTAERLAERTVPFRAGFAGKVTSSVLIASSSAPAYALPAAAWSAYSGDTVAFVGRDRVPAATRRLLRQRKRLRLEPPTMYVVGPRSVVSERAVRTLRRYGTVKRIPGDTAPAVSVALARYSDRATGFGWGLRHGPASVSLVNAADLGNLAGALAFAARGPRAPLLVVERPDLLPAPVERYLRSLRGEESSQAFAFGNERSVATSALRRADELLEGTAGG
jgi:hypothetical protein